MSPYTDWKELLSDTKFEMYKNSSESKEWGISRKDLTTYTIFKNDMTEGRYVIVKKVHTSTSNAAAYVTKMVSEKTSSTKGYVKDSSYYEFNPNTHDLQVYIPF